MLHFNGIDGATGHYLAAPLSISSFAATIREEPLSLAQKSRGVVAGIDAEDPCQAGWGILFAHDEEREIKEALEPLLQLRGKGEEKGRGKYFQELFCNAGESASAFLRRHGVVPGPVVPKILPYYLLIASSPEKISFQFQEALSIQYAVGRLSFETAEEYARYANSLVAAEREGLARRRRASFFGVRNADDSATFKSAQGLAEPLAQSIESSFAENDWQCDFHEGEAANKKRLSDELHGENGPAFLFTAGHAVGFPSSSPEVQRERQGGLLMSDWPGPKKWSGPISREHYFAAHDLDADARVHGLVSFHFACFSGGTPEFDAFGIQSTNEPIAEQPFVARLPQALLAHPAGGALAVIGHVDRAWPTSFQWRDAGFGAAVFQSTVRKILNGCPVGHAMDDFAQRYAELAVRLHIQKLAASDKPVEDHLAVELWMAYHDSRGYILLGDPAARLNVERP